MVAFSFNSDNHSYGFCTIAVDASYCQHSNISTFGAIFTKKGARKSCSGSICCQNRVGAISNSTDAEFGAVLDAITYGISTGLIHNCAVHVITDCEYVVKYLTNGRKGVSKSNSFRLNCYNQIMNYLEIGLIIRLTCKHVKGHSSDKNARTIVNNKCHDMAKKRLNSARVRRRKHVHTQ